jgi:bifunctional N-acetylglucosamine-1-phosphate-uridyltransferase/glucosamine-1-phosphate-acetyltransferase GlmU-like protein
MQAGLKIGRENWREYANDRVHPELWTAIVPAAGRGSRLGYSRPKLLYPVAGRMILEWLLDFLLPNCDRLVFVVSPDGEADIAGELERLAAGRYRTVIQEVPTGMGDAVALGLAAVETVNTVVVWGDQVALRPDSVSACLRVHEGPLEPAITCPTVMRGRPYIHFERAGDGAIGRVLQAREGDPMPETGESDTGFFCFRTEIVRGLLQELRTRPLGAATQEFNLLPAIPLASEKGFTVLTPHLMTLEETVGINSKEDVAVIEGFLRSVPSGLYGLKA